MTAGVMLVGVLVALPPPLCRGKTGRYDPRQNKTVSTRAGAEIHAAYDALCPVLPHVSDIFRGTEVQCPRAEVYENDGIGHNALTWVDGSIGKYSDAMIVYSAEFLNTLNSQFGPGASFGVLAHEVGHHLTAIGGMRQQFESSWNEELRADWFAGCAIGRSGRSSAELEAALRALASVATQSHPSFQQRGPAVRKGFNECVQLQEKIDAAEAKKKPAFGIGSMLRAKSGKGGCWGYWYRSAADVNRLGPVAAKRRRSRDFKSRKACDRHRKKSGDTTEACKCL